MTIQEIEYVRDEAYDYQREREQEIALAQAAAGGDGCRPWCRFHLSYVDGPDSCYSHPRGFHADEPYLVDERGEWGHRLHWPAAENATPQEAEAFARRLLDLVHEARKDTHVRVMVDSGDFWTPAWVPAEQSLEADR